MPMSQWHRPAPQSTMPADSIPVMHIATAAIRSPIRLFCMWSLSLPCPTQADDTWRRPV